MEEEHFKLKEHVSNIHGEDLTILPLLGNISQFTLIFWGYTRIWIGLQTKVKAGFVL